MSNPNAPPPPPPNYTLLLKSHRTTVLLSAHPTLPLRTLKHHLYTALTSTPPVPSHITSPLPPTPQALVLGLPRDPNDWARGWYAIGEDAAPIELDLSGEEDGGGGGDGGEEDGNDHDNDNWGKDKDKDKGKGRGGGGVGATTRGGAKGKGSKGKGNGNGGKGGEWTVEKVGLREGSVLAYYVRGEVGGKGAGRKEEGFVVEVPVDEGDEEDEGGEEEDEAEGMEE